MDVGALASDLIGAQTGRVQMAVAAKMLKMSLDATKSVVQLLTSADQTMTRLADAASGVGQNLDITV